MYMKRFQVLRVGGFAVLAVLIAFQCESIAEGAIKYLLPKTSERFENDVFDDDLDVSADSLDQTIELLTGDTLIWHYDYKQCYTVLSDDKADIDLLVVRAMKGLHTGTTSNVTLSFSGPWGDQWEVYSVQNHPWGPVGGVGLGLGIKKDDVLGVLKGKIIKDFHLEVEMTAGSATVQDGDPARFFWEVGDIEPIACPIPEPSSFIVWCALAALGITVGWWQRRRKAR